jgi:hypothetical protein
MSNNQNNLHNSQSAHHLTVSVEQPSSKYSGYASNYVSNRPDSYAASSSYANSATSHKLDYEQMKSAGLAWLGGTTPSNPGSATSGADKKLGQSGTYQAQSIYGTSPSLETHKKPLSYTGKTGIQPSIISYDSQGYSSTQSHALPYSTNVSEQYQSIPQGYLSTGSLPVPKPFVGSANYSTNISINGLPQNYLDVTPQPTSGRLATSGYYNDINPKYNTADLTNYLSPNSIVTREPNAKSVTNSKVGNGDLETRLIQEATKRGRVYMSTPVKMDQMRQSVLTPYRNTLYREFDEVVEDIPDRTNLLEAINNTLKKSNVRERLLTSPTRVSIVRPSNLHPAKIDVETPLIEKYEDGSLYEGEANKKRLRNGRGTISYKDGKRLEGEFKDGKIEGFGTLYSKTGFVKYEGNYHNDEFHGQGTLHNDNPQSSNEPVDFKDFSKLGNNWKKYEGDFKKGKKQGVGTLYLLDGARYYGEFNDDQVSGKGCFYLKDEPNGIAGEWKNNAFTEKF